MDKTKLKKYAYDFAALLVGGAITAGTIVLSNTETMAPVLAAMGVPPIYVPVITTAILTIVAQRAKTPQQRVDAAQAEAPKG